VSSPNLPTADCSRRFDHVIVGAGAAGLSLAWHLTRNPATTGQSIVLLDPDAKRLNDRTWSFWERADRPGLFPELVSAEWAVAEVRSEEWGRQVLPLDPYRYRTIQGADFYAAMRHHLLALPHVSWEQVAVTHVQDAPTHATAHAADGRTWRGRWAYDSRFQYHRDITQRPTRHFYLAQHFVGWEIEAIRDVFEPEIATLFDFRTPQHDQMRFVYVLPSSARRALVELTLFSEALLTPTEYEAGLRAYLQHQIGLSPADFRIIATEAGVIPMTDHPLPMRGGASIVRIGSAGGASKPSTGFTFRRVQHQTTGIVAALAATGAPWLPESVAARRFRLYDAMMLNVLAHHGGRGEEVFCQLFRRNPIERILRFLDEETTFAEEIAVMNSVPLPPFLRALAGQMRRGMPHLRTGA
jgi:lycopene beta-cyclase